jgi:hypothetical protein
MVEISSSLIALENSLQHRMLATMQRESRALAKPQDRDELGPCGEAIRHAKVD